MRKALWITAALLAFAAPALGWDADETYEHDYMTAYADTEHACGENSPGRNIVLHGLGPDFDQEAGKARTLRETADLEQMEAACLEPDPVVEVQADTSTAVVEPAPVATGGVSNATVMCESGGDYSIDTGNGYYGGYQFDSATWDAYGDSAYGEANEAPPAVQDAAAASVPYDAWPNC